MNKISVFHVVFLIAASAMLSACTIGDYGSLVTRYTHTQTATVMDVYAMGLQVRPEEEDRGLTLGYRKSTYIFAKEHPSSPAQGSEFRWFHSPKPADETLVLKGNATAGLEVQAMPEFRRTTLGYIDQMISKTAGPEDSFSYRVDYEANAPEKTRAYFKKDAADK